MPIVDYNKQIFAEFFYDEGGNKISVAVTGEQHVVANGQFYLDYVPDELYKVTVTSPANMTEIKSSQSVTSGTQYKVDYNSGRVVVDGATHEGDTFTVSYRKVGRLMYNSNRVFHDLDINGNVTYTIKEKIDSLEAEDSSLDGRLTAEEAISVDHESRIQHVEAQADDNSTNFTNHVTGADDKHTTTHITNASLNVSGTTLTDALNTIDSRMDTHVTGSTERHGTNEIDNDSAQVGSTLTDAINAIAAVVQNIEATDSNAAIGVYSLTATGVDTITSTSVGLTYFAGLKAHLTTAGVNTTSATLNINSLGAKNIKIKHKDGTKVSLAGGEMPAIADLEYDGTDFILLNGFIAKNSTSASVTSQITSLPSTAVKSRLSAMLSGNTETNIVSNGNFANGTTGWTASVGSGAVANNVYSLTGNGTENLVRLRQVTTITPNTGDKIFVRAILKVTNSDCLALRVGINVTGSTYIVTLANSQATPTINTNYVVSGIATVPAGGTNALRVVIEQQYADAATSNNKVMEVKEVMTINLTSRYGAGSEPSAADCLLRYPQWFDGTKSSDKMRVSSVGKNLFDINSYRYANASGTKGINGDSITFATTGNASGSFLARVYEGIQTTFGGGTDISTGDDTITLGSGTGGKTVTFTTTGIQDYSIKFGISGNAQDSGVVYVMKLEPSTTYKLTYNLSVNSANSCTVENIQLEKSTTVTYATRTYAPYSITSAIVPEELKSISATIKDTFDGNVGKFTKNCSDWVTLSGNAYTWSLLGATYNYVGSKLVNSSAVLSSGSYASVTSVLGLKYNGKKLTASSTNSLEDHIEIGTSVYLNLLDIDTGLDDAWDGTTAFTGMTAGGLIKAYMNGWKLTTANVNVASCVWTGIASGVTKSGAEGYAYVTTTIDAGFTPYKMIYQLATPVVTDYSTNSLIAEPSGTIYVLPFIKENLVYTVSKLSISNTTYPINAVEYVNKINIDSPNKTPISLSSVTLSSDGLSVTISGAIDGEIYELGYSYKDLSTVPTLDYSYGQNIKAQTDGNTTMIAGLDKKVEDVADFTKALENEITRVAEYTTAATSTAQIIPLSSTALKSRLDVTLSGNTQTPYDSYTKFLFLAEGADASTPATDSTGKAITWAGNAELDTAQFRYGTSSMLFYGTGDYITVTDANNELDIGTSDFCIEKWVRFPAYGAVMYLVDFRQAADTDVAPVVYINASGVLRYFTDNAVKISGTSTLAINTWYHIALVRSGGVTKLYLNGGQEGSSYTDANNYIAVTSIKIGATYAGASGYAGWIDDLRISVGTPRYTSNFTPLPMSVLSSDKMRISSVGKNLFDGKMEIGGINASGVSEVDATRIRSIGYTMVKPSTAYTVSQSGVAKTVNIYQYDEYRNFISSSGVSTVTTASNCKYIRIKFTGTLVDNSSNLQIELGSTATTYTAYTETSAIVPVELKKISSTIKDEFYANEGKFVKNIEADLDVSGIQYDVLQTALTNVDLVITTAFSLAKVGGSGVDGTTLVLDKNGKKLTEVADTAVDDAANVGKYAWSSSGKVQFIVAKGSYVDIAAARTGLGTSQVYYQLATPIVTNYLPSILTAEPSGRIVVEPFVADYDFYDGGCVVTDTTKPINSLVYVNIVNKTNGALTPVEISTCTVAADGLSFTSTATTAEDLIDYGFTTKDVSTVADVAYSYANNLKAAVDGNVKDIQLLDNKIQQLTALERSRLRLATVTIGTTSATSTYCMFIAPTACDLVNIQFVNKDGVTASDTDYWTFAVTDKGSAGAGTDVIVSKTTKTTGGQAISAYTKWDLGALNAQYTKLAAGDVVTITITKSASATTMNEGLLMVSYIDGN